MSCQSLHDILYTGMIPAVDKRTGLLCVLSDMLGLCSLSVGTCVTATRGDLSVTCAVHGRFGTDFVLRPGDDFCPAQQLAGRNQTF